MSLISNANAATTTVKTSNLIVVPSQLIKTLGPTAKRVSYLDLEQHVGDAAVLLVTLPGCDLCKFALSVVANLTEHAWATYKKKVVVYVMVAGPTNSRNDVVMRDLNVALVPCMFYVRPTNGRLALLYESTSQMQNMTVDGIVKAILPT